MPAKDFGTKFTCFKCSCKFYDLKKPDPVCPKCGVDQREAQAVKPSEGRRSRLAAVPRIIEPVEPVVDPEVVAEEDDIEAIAGDDEEVVEEEA
jgi:hypothetical protein